ncbi:MAG: beta-phosphoglucomutase family hydrolase [Planctomycetia bacterium]|nr:beta-phosphoglucomutase family hydrolase [Planctomycetia bacterium]
MSKLNFRAVIFDLDGVITQTSQVHSTAWKNMFDEYLRYRQEEFGEPFNEFTHDNDYLPFVDGKPRYEGVKAFLRARGIDLPFGDPQDPPNNETVCSLGNRKNQKFNEVLVRDGVKVYDSTITLIKELKKQGIHVGIASSSKNCDKVIKTAGIKNLFETCVDGITSAELRLNGKPEPDIFTTACNNLGIDNDQAVVVEDAVSGVRAGVKGNFGLVVGVARENNKNELKSNGADIVVTDLGELTISLLVDWFKTGLKKDQWCLNYYDYIPEQEGTRESLCTVGNGYFGIRGAIASSKADNIHYPGTYIAGVNNRLSSKINDKIVHNEDMVNCPNWLPVQFKIGDNNWVQFNTEEIIDFHRQLNLKQGILRHRIKLCNKNGQQTLVETSRLASMATPHCASLKFCITPLNYSETITIRSGITYAIRNTGVKRYQQLENQHLKPIDKGGKNNLIYVLTKTIQSNIKIAQAVKTLFLIGNKNIKSDNYLYQDSESIYTEASIAINQGQTFSIEKLVSIYTSKDDGIDNPLTIAKNSASSLENFDKLLKDSVEVWDSLWQEVDIKVEGDRLSQKLLRLNIYHLLITKSNHSNKINWGIPARGLHGEAYRGHIFWDELFIIPFYCLHFPETVKSILLYRYHRLDKAREYAKINGYQGAMFPWQSSSDGTEETQTYHLNPISKEWGNDNSILQKHISIAIAYNIWLYYQTSVDLEFIIEYGAELFLEIARFWSSMAIVNYQTGRFDIDKIMGPDEFHERYPNSPEPGLKNNSYTNIMVAWIFKKAIEILELFTNDTRQSIMANIQLTEDEINHWQDISNNITITFSDNGIIAQFDGYFDLQELNWEKYRQKYKAINRMDRILKAKGKTPDIYKVSKQADALMPFYLLSEEELKSIFTDLRYPFDSKTLKRSYDYYFPRTSHGSTLSLVVHSTLANFLGYDQLGWDLFLKSLTSDYCDIQDGTTAEGIHTGVMGGTLQHVIRVYAGIDISNSILKINPNLPQIWRSMYLNIIFKNIRYNFNIFSKKIIITVSNNKVNSVEIEVKGKQYIIPNGKPIEIILT